jgi:nitrogen regulatory protein P-II 1
MKKIEAIVRPEKIEPVRKALEEIGILGMTVINVSGRGRQKGIALEWRAGEYRIDFIPKIKLEIVLADEEYKKAVEIICKAARTGNEGDGMIFILPVEEAIRVSINEKDI